MAAQILPKAGEVIARSRIARVGGCTRPRRSE